MIMPQHTTNSTTIGTAPRPHLPVSAQTLSSPGPLLLVNCVAWTENWGVICELDVLNNNNSTTAEQMIIGIKYIQSASARVISARQHVHNIGRLCKNWQGGFLLTTLLSNIGRRNLRWSLWWPMSRVQSCDPPSCLNINFQHHWEIDIKLNCHNQCQTIASLSPFRPAPEHCFTSLNGWFNGC